ncbi:MAG: galactose mutarotase [Bacteroidaceae bacterium]|nr:galactose mutarotase [Bacteroidaceae bacterium]
MKKLFKTALFVASAAMIVACAQKDNATSADAGLKSGLNAADFDTTYVDPVRGEKKIALYTLTNHNGMEVCVTNFGGRIVSVVVPDKDGNPTDVVLGYPSAKDYFPENNKSDFGSSVGRYANRINKGQFPLGDSIIQLETNNYGHMLHGYPREWMYIPYDAEQPDSSTVILSLTSPDGEGHFPGEVKVTVTMKLTDDNAIDICYKGTTNKTTILNMTNHSYFNLSGDPTKPITDHMMQINAQNYTPTDTTYMTTGEIAKVEGTCFDFRQPKAIGTDFGTSDAIKAIENGEDHTGYDHNWCLDTYADGKGDDTKVCATAWSPVTGIQLDVYTNEPGIQFYSGNFQNGTVVGKKGIKYPKNAAFCLETQKYPDAPNKPEWPSCTLNPGEEYYSHCIYKFSIHK